MDEIQAESLMFSVAQVTTDNAGLGIGGRPAVNRSVEAHCWAAPASRMSFRR
jgi:hypothetical protein